MKNRIISLTALFLSVLLLFSGCYSAVKKKPYGDKKQAVRVLIYSLERDAAIRDPETAELPEPYVLPQEQLKDFLNKLSKQAYANSILYEPNDPNFVYYGHVVKIEYSDGASEWLSGVHMTTYIEPDGTKLTDHYTPDIDTWEALVCQYLR